MLGFRQHNPHHAFDVYTHTAYVVAGVPPELPLRWAALLHDVAKPACFTLDEEGVGHFRGHAHRGAEMAREILGQLHAPRALQDRVATLIAYHGVTRDLGRLPGDRPLRRLLRRLGRRRFGTCWPWTGRMTVERARLPDPAAFDRFEASLRQILAEQPCLTTRDLAISGRDLLELGLPQGPEWGASSGPSWRKWETAVCPTPQRSSSAGQRCCTNGTMQTDGKAEFCNGAAAPLASPGKDKALPPFVQKGKRDSLRAQYEALYAYVEKIRRASSPKHGEFPF